MTASPHLLILFSSVIESITLENGDLSADTLESLRFFFHDTLLLAALDLIDRESVIKYKTPWGRAQYEVLGSTNSYAVFPEMLLTNMQPMAYCTCPAFAYSVLLSGSHLMCKHLLATILAERLSRCSERHVDPNEFANIVVRQCA